jgi:hypothetical protein
MTKKIIVKIISKEKNNSDTKLIGSSSNKVTEYNYVSVNEKLDKRKSILPINIKSRQEKNNQNTVKSSLTDIKQKSSVSVEDFNKNVQTIIVKHKFQSK